ncbi:PucR family transcriptional regulator [Rhodococcus aetherivorans]
MDSTETRRSVEIAALLDQVFRDLDVLTDLIVAAIRREAPSYQTFPLERHREDSLRGMETIITGLRSGEGPTRAALEHAATIGRDRARFGISLIDAIEGYHVVYRELWNHLLSRAVNQGPEVTAALSQEVALLWTCIHQVSSAFTAAYSAESARVQAGRQEMRTRLVALLLSDAPPIRQASSLAASLGFDVESDFVALCTEPTTSAEVDAINQRFESEETRAHCALDAAERAVILGQGIDPGNTARELHEHLEGRIGIGTPGRGMSGARLSLADASVAVATATSSHPVVDFVNEWPTALHAAQPHRIAHVVGAGCALARENPHLAGAVTAFAGSRFSIAAAAGLLHVHPNTAKYRLDRWAQLTGWDVFTADGLAASRVAIGLARATGSP